MGSPEPYSCSVVQGIYIIPERPSKVVKRKQPPRKPSKASRQPLLKALQQPVKQKNGLLKTKIAARSDAMQIAKSNSLESPLLRLPGEIRNKIWQYAIGYHLIDIRNKSLGGRLTDVELGYDARHQDLQSGSIIPRVFVKPTFALPSVCRQMYVETSAIVYTLNMFAFTDLHTLDRFIKDRAIGQRRLVTSIDVPFDYFCIYSDGFRKKFRETFPNLKRVGVHVQVALSTQRVITKTWNWIKPIKEPLIDTKKRLECWVKEKEGADLEVDWHGGTSASFVYLH